ncbi:NAD-P-binding protein [Gloeopeniophorella convolvens]|nr:NAD-P-binding protein [Gloeopeniophorella convolvens]
MAQIIGADEDLTKVTVRHDIYPAIDPKPLYDAQAYKGKAVLITGASRGIGLQTALQFALAGADLTIVARKQETLDASRATVLASVPAARVLTFVADVRDPAKAQEAVAATVRAYGKLDVLVANAAALRPMTEPFAQRDPTGWWDVQEINIRGTYNYVHYAVPELLKTKGKIVALSSGAAQYRLPFASDYCISKFAVNRFVEFVAVEYPDIKVFALHPGVVETQMSAESGAPVPPVDAVALPASTILYLVSGRADYLSSRYVSSNWDLAEVERDWKEKIVATNGLVNKLSIPA